MLQRDMKDSELYEASYHFKEKRANSRFYLVLLLVVALLFGFRIWWLDRYSGVEVDGASMYSTLESGDKLLMRTVEKGATAERGDVIVVYVGSYAECKDVESGFLIKRLIATGGDEVRCKAGVIEIKYKGSDEYVTLDEPYARYLSLKDKKEYNFEYKVEEGEIFFLGDNRNNSRDSRYGIEGGSHLENDLYKVEDIYGVVPDWAICYKGILEKIFF